MSQISIISDLPLHRKFANNEGTNSRIEKNRDLSKFIFVSFTRVKSNDETESRAYDNSMITRGDTHTPICAGIKRSRIGR